MQAISLDLDAENACLDEVLVALDEPAWDLSTPAAGWTVRDQVSHLGFFDRVAAIAVTDPDAFARARAELVATGGTARSVAPGATMRPSTLLEWWRDGRGELSGLLRALDPKTRIPWFGPAMSARSFATARLMEAWAHGQDVVDAVGVRRQGTDRLRHVAHIGVQARPFSYAVRGLEVPAEPVRVTLVSPSGALWGWGDETAADVISGPALDFCLVVTQRRHPADVALLASGERAVEWLGIAQAFAGPPGSGRHPGQFAR